MTQPEAKIIEEAAAWLEDQDAVANDVDQSWTYEFLWAANALRQKYGIEDSEQ